MIARQTKQKTHIQEAIQSFDSFFNAEELHAKVQKKKIGKATVYRSLSTLVDNGELHSYLCDRTTIYSTNKKNHSHFTCEVCGTVEHLSLKKLDFLKKEVKGDICHFQIDISGICKKCKKE